MREGLGHSWGRIHWGVDAGQLVSGRNAVCDCPLCLGILGLGKKQVRKKREQDLLLVEVLGAKAEEQSWKPPYWRAVLSPEFHRAWSCCGVSLLRVHKPAQPSQSINSFLC